MEQFEIFIKTMVDDGLMSSEQYAKMETLFLSKVKEVELPNIIVFLDSDPQINMDRILKRGREGEANKV